MNLSDLNTCDPAAFVTALGAVWEHSPWIAERACAMRSFSSVEALSGAMWQCVVSASDDEKMSLIGAHPDLAGKLARARLLTPESTNEQASAWRRPSRVRRGPG
ncbi:MAG: 2-oxo-4-hydroxy-4-carboxy-5-ureidoimidazoline decarboxylase [Chthoniobacterales bacterium]